MSIVGSFVSTAWVVMRTDGQSTSSDATFSTIAIEGVYDSFSRAWDDARDGDYIVPMEMNAKSNSPRNRRGVFMKGTPCSS